MKRILKRRGDDILGVEIYENGNSISKTGTVSMLGRAFIGSLIRPIGTVIGGVTAKKKSVEIVNKIDVAVSIKNTRKPLIIIPVRISKRTKKNSKKYKRAMKKS
ncbi:hypothetical protein [Acetivibrio saccincola]|uniref:hypothetical protein n=1 Tax=Acetivibrio saccincola TaxID=1677857 RepID=UPI00131D6048|nr:hypothetical protein [Acetivibrio saccincola]